MTRKYINVSDVPLALAVFLATDDYDYDSDQFTISATTLLKPIRQLILTSRIPPEDALVSLPDLMASRMGSAIHSAIEHAWKTNYVNAMKQLGYPQKIIDRIKLNPPMEEILNEDAIPIYLEQRLSRQFGRWKITGKFDFIGEGRVQDFKSTGVYTYMKQTNAGKYSLQGSIYRWLDPKKITQNDMDIHYIFTDWKAQTAKTDKTYPQRRFLKQTYPLMSLMETERYISNRIQMIETFWNKPEDRLPDCGDEDLWRSDPVFKYYKNPNKLLRSTKNFDTYQEAVMQQAADGAVGIVKEVPGQVTACKYCPAFMACTQKDRLIASGELIMN